MNKGKYFLVEISASSLDVKIADVEILSYSTDGKIVSEAATTNASISSIKSLISRLDVIVSADRMRISEDLVRMERTPLSEMDISIRSRNVLRNLGILTIDHLIQTRIETLLATPNCGRKTITEIRAALSAYGLDLKYT